MNITYIKIGSSALDINIHDTYFVIANFDFAILISFALAFIGLIYYLHFRLDIPHFKFLTKIHTLVTIGCIILYFLSPLFHNDNDFPLFNNQAYINDFLIYIFILGITIQSLLIVNSFIGLFNKFYKN